MKLFKSILLLFSVCAIASTSIAATRGKSRRRVKRKEPQELARRTEPIAAPAAPTLQENEIEAESFPQRMLSPVPHIVQPFEEPEHEEIPAEEIEEEVAPSEEERYRQVEATVRQELSTKINKLWIKLRDNEVFPQNAESFKGELVDIHRRLLTRKDTTKLKESFARLLHDALQKSNLWQPQQYSFIRLLQNQNNAALQQTRVPTTLSGQIEVMHRKLLNIRTGEGTVDPSWDENKQYEELLTIMNSILSRDKRNIHRAYEVQMQALLTEALEQEHLKVPAQENLKKYFSGAKAVLGRIPKPSRSELTYYHPWPAPATPYYRYQPAPAAIPFAQPANPIPGQYIPYAVEVPQRVEPIRVQPSPYPIDHSNEEEDDDELLREIDQVLSRDQFIPRHSSDRQYRAGPHGVPVWAPTVNQQQKRPPQESRTPMGYRISPPSESRGPASYSDRTVDEAKEALEGFRFELTGNISDHDYKKLLQKVYDFIGPEKSGLNPQIFSQYTVASAYYDFLAEAYNSIKNSLAKKEAFASLLNLTRKTPGKNSRQQTEHAQKILDWYVEFGNFFAEAPVDAPEVVNLISKTNSSLAQPQTNQSFSQTINNLLQKIGKLHIGGYKETAKAFYTFMSNANNWTGNDATRKKAFARLIEAAFRFELEKAFHSKNPFASNTEEKQLKKWYQEIERYDPSAFHLATTEEEASLVINHYKKAIKDGKETISEGLRKVRLFIQSIPRTFFDASDYPKNVGAALYKFLYAEKIRKINLHSDEATREEAANLAQTLRDLKLEKQIQKHSSYVDFQPFIKKNVRPVKLSTLYNHKRSMLEGAKKFNNANAKEQSAIITQHIRILNQYKKQFTQVAPEAVFFLQTITKFGTLAQFIEIERKLPFLWNYLYLNITNLIGKDLLPKTAAASHRYTLPLFNMMGKAISMHQSFSEKDPSGKYESYTIRVNAIIAMLRASEQVRFEKKLQYHSQQEATLKSYYTQFLSEQLVAFLDGKTNAISSFSFVSILNDANTILRAIPILQITEQGSQGRIESSPSYKTLVVSASPKLYALIKKSYKIYSKIQSKRPEQRAALVELLKIAKQKELEKQEDDLPEKPTFKRWKKSGTENLEIWYKEFGIA
jgi:hypothetical protein